jgi:hypothetical protein
MTAMADIIVDIDRESEAEAPLRIAKEISAYFMLGMNSPNTSARSSASAPSAKARTGTGRVMDGVAPGFPISEEISRPTDRRGPDRAASPLPRRKGPRAFPLRSV